MRAERPLQLTSTDPPAVGESDHLLTSVDSGVGAARALDSHPGAAREPGKCAFKLTLDRPTTRLYLETGKVSAVIFNPRAVPHGDALSSALCCRLLDQLELDHWCRIARARPDLD